MEKAETDGDLRNTFEMDEATKLLASEFKSQSHLLSCKTKRSCDLWSITTVCLGKGDGPILWRVKVCWCDRSWLNIPKTLFVADSTPLTADQQMWLSHERKWPYVTPRDRKWPGRRHLTGSHLEVAVEESQSGEETGRHYWLHEGTHMGQQTLDVLVRITFKHWNDCLCQWRYCTGQSTFKQIS